MAAKPMRRPFTVREYYKMGKAGILRPDERVELIEGDHREPTPEGYRVNLTLHRGDRLAPAALPDLEFAVDDILGRWSAE